MSPLVLALLLAFAFCASPIAAQAAAPITVTFEYSHPAVAATPAVTAPHSMQTAPIGGSLPPRLLPDSDSPSPSSLSSEAEERSGRVNVTTEVIPIALSHQLERDSAAVHGINATSDPHRGNVSASSAGHSHVADAAASAKGANRSEATTEHRPRAHAEFPEEATSAQNTTHKNATIGINKSQRLVPLSPSRCTHAPPLAQC